MKKIMFDDKYALTEAVLRGYKMQTRRLVPKSFFKDKWCCVDGMLYLEDEHGVRIDICDTKYARYKAGETVAIAQSYKEISEKVHPIPSFASKAGLHNKMFVSAELMPHQILITGLHVERLQDISDEDCMKEGVREVLVNNNWGNCASHYAYEVPYEERGKSKRLGGSTPREAYEMLIDKISGWGTFEENPFVFVYDFKLIK